MNKLSWVVSCIAFLALIDNIKGYFVTIESHSEECFFDRAETGTKLGLMFETVEGGFLDIDVKITGPDGKVIYEGFRESAGKYTFAAHSTGIYSYCFNNKMSSLTTKVVMFSMDIGEAPKGTPGAANEEDANHVKLNDMIKDLAETLTAIKHEQEYMNIRDRIHRSINESTNSRVVLWSVFEAVVLIVMTVGQVYYLKRYFEVRRVV